MTKSIIVLGVSGSGKSLIGQKIADKFGYQFFDADDFHSDANVEKMRQGIPLNDDDRQGWLVTLNELLVKTPNAVLACSALKPAYREILRRHLEDVSLVYLKGDIDTIWQRHQKRDGHYFNGRAMLESQFETLIEPTPDEALIVDISQDAETVLQQAIKLLSTK
ncbi:MAG: gluconokinase [Marinomonas sp.]